ncbi:MAG: energy transducer TonB, partial [Candidatus Manganitrophaceae bacterium]
MLRDEPSLKPQGIEENRVVLLAGGISLLFHLVLFLSLPLLSFGERRGKGFSEVIVDLVMSPAPAGEMGPVGAGGPLGGKSNENHAQVGPSPSTPAAPSRRVVPPRSPPSLENRSATRSTVSPQKPIQPPPPGMALDESVEPIVPLLPSTATPFENGEGEGSPFSGGTGDQAGGGEGVGPSTGGVQGGEGDGGVGGPGGGPGGGGITQTREPLYAPLVQVTRMPLFKGKVVPVYPEEAKRLEKEGTVILEVRISEGGEVLKVDVVQGAGYGFDEAAKEAMERLRFEPAYLGDRPVAVILRIPIRFRLKG